MFFNPAILALVGVNALVSGLLLLAAGFALQVLRYWDLASGSERQLRLERRTYLISTILGLLLVAESLSLWLFVHTAESLHNQFVGAMCATGVLNQNPWGWPTLFLKLGVFAAGALWLVLNWLDQQGYDYPLVRVKYAWLLPILPLVLVEGWSQLEFFLALDPEVITSCCGALFSSQSQGLAAEVAGLDPRTSLVALAVSGGLVMALAGVVARSGRGSLWLAAVAAVALILALIALVSSLAVYIYEHPQHHCPFCLLKSQYHFIGYALYLPLLVGAVAALAAGLVSLWRQIPSLEAAVASAIRRFAWLAWLGFGLFYGLAILIIVRSHLSLLE